MRPAISGRDNVPLSLANCRTVTHRQHAGRTRRASSSRILETCARQRGRLPPTGLLEGGASDRRTSANGSWARPGGHRQGSVHRSASSAAAVCPRRLARSMVLVQLPGLLRRQRISLSRAQHSRQWAQPLVKAAADLFAGRLHDVESVATSLPSRPVVIGHSQAGASCVKRRPGWGLDGVHASSGEAVVSRCG